MRRVLLSVLIAVGLLAVRLIDVAVLPSVRLCPEGWMCGPTSVESGVGWLFMPGFLVALPLYFLVDVNERLVLAVVAVANIAFYASVVWLLLTLRTRRLERARTPTLPL